MRIIYLFFGLICLGCSTGIEPEVEVETAKLDGRQLMEDNCYACHNTQGTDNMLAPPMFRVKDHYWDDNISKDEFVKAIVDWVENPIEENSVMPGARRKFGLMPKQSFEAEELKAIAEYMFDNDLD
jgi:mono/diheme cytochrome c family protein